MAVCRMSRSSSSRVSFRIVAAILLQGSLVQLSDESVQLASANIQEDQLDTVTRRLSLYRDETSLAWTEVTKAPVRKLLRHTPGLLLCKDPACTQTCGKFHAVVDEAVDRLVLDVWGRQWAKLTPSKAEAFHCLIRVPSSALPHPDRLGVAGFYFEPALLMARSRTCPLQLSCFTRGSHQPQSLGACTFGQQVQSSSA